MLLVELHLIPNKLCCPFLVMVQPMIVQATSLLTSCFIMTACLSLSETNINLFLIPSYSMAFLNLDGSCVKIHTEYFCAIIRDTSPSL